jgi:hypothetical protein
MRSIILTAVLPAMVLGLLATPGSGVFAQEFIGEGQIAGTKVLIREIKRDEGGTVTVRFQLINETDTPHHSSQFTKTTALNQAIHLIDESNKRKYLVVEDSSGRCVCAPLREEVRKDRPINLWVKFPAPPESVRKVSVIVSGFEPIESVPITAR